MASSLIPLELPPGVHRPGTIYDARGRWFDSNLVRWYESAMLPVRGWAPLFTTGTGGGAVNVGEAVRGMHGWKGNDQSSILAFGTPTKLWLFRLAEAEQLQPGFASELEVISDVEST